MEAGNVNEFLEKITYQEEAVLYRGRKYFFNPTGNESEGQARLDIERWTDKNLWERDILHIEAPTHAECVKRMTAAPVWDGRTFWEVETEMNWTEW